MGNSKKKHFSQLRPVVFGTKRIGKISFDHAKNSFGLSALPIRFFVPVKLHFPSILSLGQFVSWLSYFRWNNCIDIFSLLCVLMVGFTIISSIGGHRLDNKIIRQFPKYLFEMSCISSRSSFHVNSEDHMIACITDYSHLWSSCCLEAVFCFYSVF